jgi:hypothetical protein
MASSIELRSQNKSSAPAVLPAMNVAFIVVISIGLSMATIMGVASDAWGEGRFREQRCRDAFISYDSNEVDSSESEFLSGATQGLRLAMSLESRQADKDDESVVDELAAFKSATDQAIKDGDSALARMLYASFRSKFILARISRIDLKNFNAILGKKLLSLTSEEARNKQKKEQNRAILQESESTLRPWIQFLVVPVYHNWISAIHLPVNNLSGNGDLLRQSVAISVEARLARSIDLQSVSFTHDFDEHSEFINFVSFSSDGLRIVTASDDHTARVWDVGGQIESIVLRGHGDWVRSARFSSDGKFVITSSDDGTALIWRPSSRSPVHKLAGHSSSVYYAELSHDAKQAVTASLDNSARIWDVPTGKSLFQLNHPDEVYYASFSSNGLFVVTACKDSLIRIWSATSGQPIKSLTGHTGKVKSAAFSPDDKLILTTSEDGTARVWSADSGLELFKLHDAKEGISFAVFNPNDSGMLVVSMGGDLHFYKQRLQAQAD